MLLEHLYILLVLGFLLFDLAVDEPQFIGLVFKPPVEFLFNFDKPLLLPSGLEFLNSLNHILLDLLRSLL